MTSCFPELARSLFKLERAQHADRVSVILFDLRKYSLITKDSILQTSPLTSLILHVSSESKKEMTIPAQHHSQQILARIVLPPHQETVCRDESSFGQGLHQRGLMESSMQSYKSCLSGI